jgi:hypothetical protein
MANYTKTHLKGKGISITEKDREVFIKLLGLD